MPARQKAKWVVVHAIYERSVLDSGGDYPVVEHHFFGRTQEEALGYYHAHMKTDAFLRGCEMRGRWSNVDCTTRVSVRRI